MNKGIFVLLLFFALGVHAQEAQTPPPAQTGVSSGETKASVEASDSDPKKVKIISFMASLRESSNLISSHGRERQTVLDLTADMRLGDWGQLSLGQGIAKSHQREETLDFTNTRIDLRHVEIPIHRDVSIYNGVITRLPTNRKTREKDRLQLTLGIENLIHMRPGQGPIRILNRVIANKNFHEYTVNANSVPTVEWSLIEGLSLLGEISQSINLIVDFEYLTSRTYRGTTKSRLDISEEIAIDVSKDVALGIGHTNGDDLITSSEKASSIEAFDQTNSTIYGAITVRF